MLDAVLVVPADVGQQLQVLPDPNELHALAGEAVSDLEDGGVERHEAALAVLQSEAQLSEPLGQLALVAHNGLHSTVQELQFVRNRLGVVIRYFDPEQQIFLISSL